jgi:hypothetical protein
MDRHISFKFWFNEMPELYRRIKQIHCKSQAYRFKQIKKSKNPEIWKKYALMSLVEDGYIFKASKLLGDHHV